MDQQQRGTVTDDFTTKVVWLQYYHRRQCSQKRRRACIYKEDLTVAKLKTEKGHILTSVTIKNHYTKSLWH